MKNIVDFLKNQLNESVIEESKIESEKDFREAAEKKFKAVFKDDLDEEKMKETIDGLLKDNKDLVDKGAWDELIGILNKSFNENQVDESKSCCKDLDKCSEDELWDALGELHKIKDEKERDKMFNDIKQRIQKIKGEK